MRGKRKITSLILALVMLMGVFAPLTTYATEVVKTSSDPKAVTKSVTLHKLMMTKDDLAAWESPESYDGTQTMEELNKLLTGGKTVSEVAGVYFAFKYKGGNNDGKFVTISENPQNPAVESDYGVTDSLDNVPAGYKLLAGLTTANGISFNTAGLKGEFEIVEVHDKSTYTNDGSTITNSKAVPVEITLPLVNNEGTVIDAHVYPKNTEDKPKIDKDFAGQANPDTPRDKSTSVDHQIGDVIPYEIKTVIPAQAKYATAKWDDKMTEGLTLDDTSIVAKVGETVLNKGADYTITTGNNGFVLTLTTDGLAKINNQEAETTVTITYSATLNKNAVVEVPESNDVMFHYGNNPGHGNTPIPGKPNPDTKKVTLKKTWAEGTAPVGAEAKFDLVNAQTGEVVAADITLNAGNSWTYESAELDTNTEYKFVEKYVIGYSAEYSAPENGTFGVKNYKDNNPAPLNPTEPKVVTYGKKFVKTDSSAEPVRLSGAEFVVKNSDNQYLSAKSGETVAAEAEAVKAAKAALDEKIAAYNALSAENQAGQAGKDAKTAIDTAQKTYNDAVFTASDKYEWVADKTKAAVLVSDGQGRFEIKGLKAGTYKLEETKAPNGFAKISDIEFTVDENSYSADGNIKYNTDDNANNAQQVINKKVVIPQTGGIGTIIFTVGGLALMGGATFALKRNKEEEEE